MSPEKRRPFLPDTPEIARAKKSREEDKEKLRAKLARPESKGRKPSPEAVAAVKELDKKQLEALRKKLAGIEVSIKFPEGTEDVMPLSEKDVEEVEDLTGEMKEE